MPERSTESFALFGKARRSMHYQRSREEYNILYNCENKNTHIQRRETYQVCLSVMRTPCLLNYSLTSSSLVYTFVT